MRIDVIAFSTNGCATALRVGEVLADEDVRLYCKTSSDCLGIERVEGSVRDWTRRAFSECDAIVFIGAIALSFMLYSRLVKWAMKKFDLEDRMDPIFSSKRNSSRSRMD